MSITRSVRRAARRQELDREQWADLDKVGFDFLLQTRPESLGCVDPPPGERQWVEDPSFERTLEIIGPKPPGVTTPSDFPTTKGTDGWEWEDWDGTGSGIRPFHSPLAMPSPRRVTWSDQNPRSGARHVRVPFEFTFSQIWRFGWTPVYGPPCITRARVLANEPFPVRRYHQIHPIAHVESGQTVEVSAYINAVTTGNAGQPRYRIQFQGWHEDPTEPGPLWIGSVPAVAQPELGIVLNQGVYDHVNQSFQVPSGHGTHWVAVGVDVGGVTGSGASTIQFDLDDLQVFTR